MAPAPKNTAGAINPKYTLSKPSGDVDADWDKLFKQFEQYK